MNQRTVIAVFCYKRAEKLRQSISALLMNPECADMDIVFFCDGAKGEKDVAGVTATRDYINNITGFRSVEKQFRERNLSTGPNFHQGISYLFSNYDQFIVVEDDLIVSPNYLRYMLDALDFYRHQPDVFCISGFSFPIDKRNYQFDTVVHNRFCSYGWACWSDRVSKVVFDKEGLETIVRQSPGFRSRLNEEGLDLYRMTKKQISGEISTWDIQMQIHVSENRMKVIYPVLSKTHNIGFDAESTNTFGVDYLKTVTDKGNQRGFRFCLAGSSNPWIQKQLREPYSLGSLVKRKVANTFIKWTNNVKPAPVNKVS